MTNRNTMHNFIIASDYISYSYGDGPSLACYIAINGTNKVNPSDLIIENTIYTVVLN